MKKRKILIGICAAAGTLVLALGIFLLVWFFGDSYPQFDALARAEAEIPGLADGLCPQGLCPLPAESGYRFAMSGYFSGAPSRIYLIAESGETKYVTLKEGEEEISTHFGGITCTGNYLVVASGKRLVRVPLAEVLPAENGAAIPVTDGFKIADFRSVAYCYYADGLLYAGEFYRPGNYETDQSHHIAVGDWETNYGIVYAYEADEAQVGGVKRETPVFAISVREQVQGFAVWEGGIALSTSYGLPDSRLWFYEDPRKGEPIGELGGVPLYALGESNLVATVVLPCMSEEIFEEEGRLFVLFESKANKYKLFVRQQLSQIYSLPVQTSGADE